MSQAILLVASCLRTIGPTIRGRGDTCDGMVEGELFAVFSRQRMSDYRNGTGHGVVHFLNVHEGAVVFATGCTYGNVEI